MSSLASDPQGEHWPPAAIGHENNCWSSRGILGSPHTHTHTPTHPHTHTPTRPHTHTPTRPHTHTPTHPLRRTSKLASPWCGRRHRRRRRGKGEQAREEDDSSADRRSEGGKRRERARRADNDHCHHCPHTSKSIRIAPAPALTVVVACPMPPKSPSLHFGSSSS